MIAAPWSVISERRKLVLNKNGRYLAYCIVQVVILTLVAGCSSERTKAVLDLVPLSLRLEERFEESSIVIELDDKDTLGVTVTDAAANGLTRDQAAEQAREIASFVCANYDSMAEIDRVRVTCEIHQDRAIVGSTSSASYTFGTSELECDRN
jgi:hypothetical protein